MKYFALIFVMMASLGAAVPLELQYAEIVFPKQDWDRGNLFFDSEPDERIVSGVAKLELKLRWAIVSGNFGEAVDRVRARIRFNEETWIDLYAFKVAYSNYKQNIVSLRVDGGQYVSGANDRKPDPQEEDDSPAESTLPNLRIVDWNHDKLLIKLSAHDKDPNNLKDTYFRFDLSQ